MKQFISNGVKVFLKNSNVVLRHQSVSRQDRKVFRTGGRAGKKGAAREKSIVFVADRLPDYFDVTIDERQLFPVELAKLFF